MSDDLRYNYTAEEPGEGRSPVLPPGDYDFEVKEVFDFETSRAGNDMLPFELIIFGPDGTKGKVSEFFVFTASARWKIDGFLKSTKTHKPGERVNFNNLSWMQRARGRCTIGIETYTHKGKDGEKNVLTAYLYDKIEIVPPNRTAPAPAAAAPPAADADDSVDDIPF